MTRIVALVIGGPIESWRRLGLEIDGGGCAVVGTVELRFVGGQPGIRCALVDRASTDNLTEIDASPWGVADVAVPAHASGGGLLRAVQVDHIVLMTNDLDRTCEAVSEALDEPLKRVREAGNGVRQGFFRLGEVVLEVVESPQVPAGPASWWGLVLVVDDLDAAVEYLGELISPPKPAVQRGRRIASLRQSADLGVPVALMTRN